MDSLARLGQRVSEQIKESTRDYTFANGGKDLLDGVDNSAGISRLLDSSHERDKVSGMKALVALISKGRNVASFFPLVVKNVGSSSSELRKLIYIYILRYAEQEPDLTLLSINTFQKDLNDGNPLIRSKALRVLAGIRVPSIGSIVLMAIKKGASDPNPYVRKASALAIPKLFSADPSHYDTLLPILEILLSDRSPVVIGSAVYAFTGLCPLRLDLLHRHFRKLCAMVVDCDEFGQVALVELLGRYARTMLLEPNAFNADEENPSVDYDLLLLLQSTNLLLSSSSPAVVISAVRLHHHLSPQGSPLPHLGPPLIRVLASRSQDGVTLAVLRCFKILVTERPDIFDDDSSFWRNFIVGVGDSRAISLEKIAVMQGLSGKENVRELVQEFLYYERSPDPAVSSVAITAIGVCVKSQPEIAPLAVKALMKLLSSKRESTTTTSILVLRNLILSPSSTSLPTSDASPAQLVSRISRGLSSINNSVARATIISLVGEFPGEDGCMGKEILRLGIKSFLNESSAVKLSLISLAVKLLALPSGNAPELQLLSRHLLTLSKYDEDYDVRDRARFARGLVRGLLDESSETGNGEQDEEGDAERGGVVLRREQIQVILGGGRTGDLAEAGPSEDPTAKAELGTVSFAIAPYHLASYRPLPAWLEQGTESSLRDTEEEEGLPPTLAVTSLSSALASQLGSSGGFDDFGSGNSSPGLAGAAIPTNTARKGFVDLDRFYDSDNEESEEDDDEDEDDEDEDEAEAEDEDEDEEEDEEDEDEEDDNEGDEAGQEGSDEETEDEDETEGFLRS